MRFEDFVLSLFNTPESSFNQDFKEKIKTISDVEVQSFWNSLLNFLNQRQVESKTTLIEEDFQENSFFDFIQNQSDKDTSVATINNYWNESIQDMINYFYTYFDEYNPEFTQNFLKTSRVQWGKMPTSNNTSFNSNDIKNADAGNVFSKVTSEIWGELVRPWYNIDWDTYYKIRTAGDLIDQKAAKTKDNLTFTREQQEDEFVNQLSHYIRLIMPNNSRRVSIEDLNRNFWVISSVLQAICSYLFDPAAPIPHLFKDTLNELAQLWDNVLYLWAAFGIISQKEAADMRIIIMPLPNSKYQTYVKYDNFSIDYGAAAQEAGSEELLVKLRLEFLTKKYSHSNLCILLYTRNNNYYQNYYASQTYRGIAFYNAKKEKFSYVPLKAFVEGQGSNYSVYFNPDNYKTYLYAMRETETYYKWSFPIANISNIVEDTTYKSKRFYGALRIEPEISFEVNAAGDLQVSKLNLIAIDAMEKALYRSGKQILGYLSTEVITENSQSGTLTREVYVSGEPALGNLDIYDAAISQAYYLGEIPSCSGLSASQPVFVYSADSQILGEGKLIKIGNYLPATFTNYYTNSDYYGEQLAPNWRSTDYLLNLTITGSSHKSTVSAIYGGHLGSTYVIPSQSCLLYVPRISSSGKYSFEEYKTTDTDGTTEVKASPSKMNTEKYKNLGNSVILEYLKNGEAPSVITYYIAGVGIRPWHNTTSHDLFQGYWSTTMLTHMFRYIPIALEKYFEPEDLQGGQNAYDKNGKRIGTLHCLGAVNKREEKFDINSQTTFATSGGTTWRLPQLFPERKIAEYLTYVEQTSELTYFVDLSRTSPLKTAYENNGISGVTQELNNNYSDYINLSPSDTYYGVVMTDEGLRPTFHNPSGLWAVFDGNSNANYNRNHDTYTKTPDRREVAYVNFNFSSAGMQLDNDTSYGRSKEQSNFARVTNADIILPPSRSTDMDFSNDW